MNREIIESAGYSRDDHNQVVNALRTLTQLGVFDLMIQAGKQQLLGQFNDDAGRLTQQILDLQQTNRLLLTLNSLGSELELRTTDDA